MVDAPISLSDVSTETKIVVGLIGGAEFVNHMYIVLFPPILGILAAEFEATLAMLGLAMGVQGFTNAVFQLPFGYLSDRYDRRSALALSLSLSTTSVFLIALSPTYEILLVGQALLGIGIAGHHPIHFPLLAAATPERHRARAFSVRGFLGSLGFGAPPIIITMVIGVPGLTWRHAVALIGLLGGVYLIVTLIVLGRYVTDEIVKPPIAAQPNERSVRNRVRQEFSALISSPAIFALAFLAFVSATASWGVTSYAVVLLTDGYGLPLDTANVALTLMFVAGAVMVLVGGELSDRFTPGPILVVSYAFVALFIGLFASLVIPAWVAVVSVLLVGGLRTLAGPARSKLADAFSARSEIGRNFAIITVGTMVGNAVAPPVFGTLIDQAGFRIAFIALGGVTALAIPVTLVILDVFGTDPTKPADLKTD